MGILEKLRNRHMTAYITINPRNCVACWDCLNACPKQVLGKIDFLGHRHIKIKKTLPIVLAAINVSECANTTLSPD